ncbi:redoxin domain-containing protein [Salmonirosea aquatica]|uniref:Redoxin domain-containing protein n=1 Tax=Salmonirosea aquatica TaxID=2654236 RepID=A0A7C9F7T3_9BACT|nr:redoxin domain-containing protein [Cytophagaceae bacterium SJW1-29]
MRASLVLLATILLAFSTTSEAQDLSVSEILGKMNQAVEKFEQGQFTFHEKNTRFGTDRDTTRSEHTYLCFFKKNPEDSLVGYQLASFQDDGYQQIYDGKVLFALYNKKLEVIRKRDYPANIEESFNTSSGAIYIINTNKWIQYDNQKLQITGTEIILGEKCFRLQNIEISKDLKSNVESYYYVSTKSFLPIKSVTILKSVLGKAEETQMFDYSITNIKDKPIEAKQFSREALSEYQIEKIYDPAVQEARDALLPLGSQAPDWKLPLLTGGTMALSDLKGKIVVMDFWFKSCAPCIQQMISLEALHKKFPNEKVVVLGVNTTDDPEKDKLELFLKNRLVTTNSVYNGNSIASLYKVYASPALFVINQEGSVVFTKSGYTSTILDEVSKVINEQLN